MDTIEGLRQNLKGLQEQSSGTSEGLRQDYLKGLQEIYSEISGRIANVAISQGAENSQSAVHVRGQTKAWSGHYRPRTTFSANIYP